MGMLDGKAVIVTGAGRDIGREAALPAALERPATRDLLEGSCDAAGQVPCRVDGGLECFGRPIGASGQNTVCEVDPQPRGGADQLQPKAPCWATTNDLRGCPSRSILATSAIGAYGG
jgi:acetyl-CoA C-acetyltransferase